MLEGLFLACTLCLMSLQRVTVTSEFLFFSFIWLFHYFNLCPSLVNLLLFLVYCHVAWSSCLSLYFSTDNPTLFLKESPAHNIIHNGFYDGELARSSTKKASPNHDTPSSMLYFWDEFLHFLECCISSMLHMYYVFVS